MLSTFIKRSIAQPAQRGFSVALRQKMESVIAARQAEVK